jgi:predicted transcriptional regulator
MRALAAERERRHIPQVAVAQSMKTSQPAVARMETGEVDVRLSTVERYAAAIGQRVHYRLVRARDSRVAAEAE